MIYKEINIPRETVIVALALFVAFLSTQTFENYAIRIDGFAPRYNLTLFKTIGKLLEKGRSYDGQETQALHINIIYINLLGNLLIFAPVGFCPLSCSKKQNGTKACWLAFACRSPSRLCNSFDHPQF